MMKGLASLLTLSLYYLVLKKGCAVLAIQGKLTAKVTIQVLVFGITFFSSIIIIIIITFISKLIFV